MFSALWSYRCFVFYKNAKWLLTANYTYVAFFAVGCLLNFLRKRRDLVLRKRSIMVEMVIHVASAMKYLEEKNFIHRDLVRTTILLLLLLLLLSLSLLLLLLPPPGGYVFTSVCLSVYRFDCRY